MSQTESTADGSADSTESIDSDANDPHAMARSVPDGETPVRCPHCDEPFPDEMTLTLHEGLTHYDSLSAERQTAFAEAYEREQRDLRSFQLRALAGLTLLYFGFLFAYALFA